MQVQSALLSTFLLSKIVFFKVLKNFRLIKRIFNCSFESSEVEENSYVQCSQAVVINCNL